MSSPKRKSSRGRGGGRGSRGGRGGRSRGGKNARSSRPSDSGDASMRDEDVLIAFSPYIRNEDPEALSIHQRFQSNDSDAGQRAFLRAAREFLQRKESGKDNTTTDTRSALPEYAPIPNAGSLTPLSPEVREDDLVSRLDNLVMKEDPIVHVVAHSQTTPPRAPIGMSPKKSAHQPLVASPIVAPLGVMSVLPPIDRSPQTSGSFLSTPPDISKPMTPSSIDQVERIPETPAPDTPSIFPPETPTPKPRYMPKRLWTRIEQQPGRLLANNMGYDHALEVRPRQELTAKWMLPLKYLRQQVSSPNTSIEEALDTLSVGLFRRGCTENGETQSIISKMARRFQVDGQKDIVWGTVPFYAPRTPGNVVFRLYWANKPLHTLATGPTLKVEVTEAELETTLRFILSNLRAKKGTGLSSLHSLVLVLENFRPSAGRRYDGGGRAAWGCICESRKVLEACRGEYTKTMEKALKQEKEIEEMKAVQEEREGGAPSTDLDEGEHGIDDNEGLEAKIRDKTRIFLGGQAAAKRKWRDAQGAFAAVLKVVATNRAMSLLLKRDHIVMLRLELELWCPICETFAPSPFNLANEESSFNIDHVPLPVTALQFERCAASRKQMQTASLGFIPTRYPLEEILLQGQPGSERQMRPSAVETFNTLSASMGQLYQQKYFVNERIHRQRELVRSHVESVVNSCEAFPAGTKVIVFGSSANGFGSPTSDIDMCLQLPPNTSLANKDDTTGAIAMSKLGTLFEKSGMKDVNSDRLTARIPILMFTCPRPMASEGEDSYVECDLSMQNPLACLNTSLLLTYSQVHVVTRVLASMIKRWAKNRDMNSPHKHTLSTYGYIIMLLHFLTYHKLTGGGLITSVEQKTGEPNQNGKREQQSVRPPLLPNLQWMDPRWPSSPPGTTAPYQELSERPAQVIPHPRPAYPSDGPPILVNTYFYRLNDAQTMTQLQQLFPGDNLSLSILLASFFYYYAYTFDYKKHVVSLHSTMGKGLAEREVKAEQDGWKVFGSGLAIEDPFETGYDVAHVLKGTNFHRLQSEFALAYTKIADAAMGKSEWKEEESGTIMMRGMELLDWICESAVEGGEKEEP